MEMEGLIENRTSKWKSKSIENEYSSFTKDGSNCDAGASLSLFMGAKLAVSEKDKEATSSLNSQVAKTCRLITSAMSCQVFRNIV